MRENLKKFMVRIGSVECGSGRLGLERFGKGKVGGVMNPDHLTGVKFSLQIVPSRIFDFPSPPRVRCPLGDDRFAICGPRDCENEIVPEE